MFEFLFLFISLTELKNIREKRLIKEHTFLCLLTYLFFLIVLEHPPKTSKQKKEEQHIRKFINR